MDEQAARQYWGISIGEGGKYVRHARQGNYVAIGWNQLGDLQVWERRRGEDSNMLWDEFRDLYRRHFPNDTAIQIGINARQVWAFAIAMKTGDILLVREPANRKVHIAEVVSGCQYVEAPLDGCEYRHRRQVRWIREDVDREELPERLKTSLNSRLTIFNLDKHGDTIEELIGNQPKREGQGGVVTGESLVRVILDRLSDLDPREFEAFVGHLLSLDGFSAYVTEYIGDKGIDVVGTLSAGSLAEVTLKVQVKRVRANVGIKEILQLRGTLGADELGSFVTLGGFTKQAIAEAQAPGKKEVKLVDGEALVDLILKHYDELPPRYGAFLGLKRREIPLRDQFTLSREAGA